MNQVARTRSQAQARGLAIRVGLGLMVGLQGGFVPVYCPYLRVIRFAPG
jgi:hypothetical protein